MGRFDITPRDPTPTSWRSAIWPAQLKAPNARVDEIPGPACARCGQLELGHSTSYDPHPRAARGVRLPPTWYVGHEGWIELSSRIDVDGQALVALKLTRHNRARAEYAQSHGFRAVPRSRTRFSVKTKRGPQVVRMITSLPVLMECICGQWNLIREPSTRTTRTDLR